MLPLNLFDISLMKTWYQEPHMQMVVASSHHKYGEEREIRGCSISTSPNATSHPSLPLRLPRRAEAALGEMGVRNPGAQEKDPNLARVFPGSRDGGQGVRRGRLLLEGR